MLKSVGGTLEAFYFSFGENDFYVVVNLPDHVNATAITLSTNASGAFNIKTVVLLSPEEIDQAVSKEVYVRPPGK